MGKRLLAVSFLALVLLFTPLTTALAAGNENGDANGSLMQGPFIILAFATIIVMIYFCFRD
ncbi:hypothetical protein QA612_20990 [Evansella sp. AB-P1]|uniref:hypothetical protein n=1 Tax=Evansella sp. AB-P1 TaxID=3037653 RepID=UPI00241EA11D|nr:hypothetical protein [Evansella sp. AB-P1]MDG5789937.1 hypothetical protein [Evansella sp. AB-P1]